MTFKTDENPGICRRVWVPHSGLICGCSSKKETQWRPSEGRRRGNGRAPSVTSDAIDVTEAVARLPQSLLTSPMSPRLQPGSLGHLQPEITELWPRDCAAPTAPEAPGRFAHPISEPQPPQAVTWGWGGDVYCGFGPGSLTLIWPEMLCFSLSFLGCSMGLSSPNRVLLLRKCWKLLA